MSWKVGKLRPDPIYPDVGHAQSHILGPSICMKHEYIVFDKNVNQIDFKDTLKWERERGQRERGGERVRACV